MRIYIVLNGLSANFGGLTYASLSRADLLSKSYDVTILTLFSHGKDLKRSLKAMTDRGMGSKVKMRNIWNDLSSMSDEELSNLGSFKGVSLPKLKYEGRFEESTGDRTDYFRGDGSRFLTKKGHSLTLYGRDDRPLCSWTGVESMRKSWIDRLTGSDSLVIQDNPTFMNLESRTVQILHSHHELEENRVIVNNVAKYHRVIVLTRRQLKALDKTNCSVIPNIYSGEILKIIKKRDPKRGIIITRLVSHKRVDHAIRAIAKLPGFTLDIYGSGSTTNSLRELIKKLKVEDRVFIKGYNPNARELYKNYSFTLITSNNEGFCLSLIEAMAMACIPIIYEIEFGPIDMVKDGVNGFVVPNGDIDTLSRKILEVSRADNLHVIRRECTKKVEDYTPDRVLKLWTELIERK